MKNIFKYLNIAMLFIAFSTVFTSCRDNDENGAGGLGLNIKVFFPTVVVPGQPMTINGSGFNDVTEIVFPGDVKVEEGNFEVITDEMIRVKAPQGIAEGGKILVRNKAGETAESRLPLSVGKTQVLSYSVQEKDTINGNDVISIYGKDMQFISHAQFYDEDGEAFLMNASEFVHKANGRVVIKVPAKVEEAFHTITLFTIDGQVFESPEFYFIPSKSGGHWETVRTVIWENDGSKGVVDWGNVNYRFGLEGHDGNNECTATIPQDQWAIIKEGEIILLYDGADNANVRVTTGWWSATYGGGEHNCAEEAAPDTDTKYKAIKLNIKEDGNIYDLIDEQHLLFTGSDYTPMKLVYEEKIWVDGGGHFEKIRKSFWKNGEQSTIPAPSWSNEGRFACVTNSTGEETYAFSEEDWETLKTEPFRIAIEKTSENPNIRITDGWWKVNYLGMENAVDLIEPGEEGELFIEINLASDPALLGVIDSQHLLFSGEGYKLLEIYQEKEVWVEDGAAPKEVVIWEGDGSKGVVDWGNLNYRFGLEGHDGNNECDATISQAQWDVIKGGTFFLKAKGSDWVQMRITTGWWSTTWTGDDITTGSERIIDNEDGTYTIEINFTGDPILDLLDEQHLLFTGGGYTPLKLYYYE